MEEGANPCLNLREELLKKSIKSAYDQYDRHVYNFIPVELHPYVNIINHGFDATHEREWRHVGDLTFSLEDIRYVFCPRAEQEEFSSRLGTISGLEFHDLESPEDVLEHTPCLPSDTEARHAEKFTACLHGPSLLIEWSYE